VPELVSVVVTVFNGERYIAEALQSALDQTYSELEVIIVDDGSTDATVEVARSFTDPRVRIVRQPNGGTAAARGRGAREAAGSLLSYLDHDDLWYPHKLEVQVPLALDPAVGVVGCPLQYMGPSGRAIGIVTGEPTEGRQDDIADARFMPFAPSSMVMRTQLYHELGGFDEDFCRRAGPIEDIELISRVARSGRQVLLVPQVLGRYRVHLGATSFERFFTMQQALRYLRARVEAERDGRVLSWDEFVAGRRLVRWAKWQDRGRFSYRLAGMHFAEDDRRRALRYLLEAAIRSPWYTARRLSRQGRSTGLAKPATT
jgi:glycosyltransferase involved in cell wall biosynthesis